MYTHESGRPAKRTRSSFESSNLTTTLDCGMDSTTSPHESGIPMKRARLSHETSDVSKTLSCGTNSMMISPQQTYQQDSKKAFPFWELPSEIRNRIYDLLVVEDSELHFKQGTQCWTYATKPAPKQATVEAFPTTPTTVVKHHLEKQKPEILDTSILYVNSCMYNEAGSALWAQNVFCFQTALLLPDFLAKLSPRARGWIRNIEIVDWFRPGLWGEATISVAFRALSTCPNLKRVELVRTLAFDLSKPPAEHAQWLLSLPGCRKWLQQVGEMRNDPKAGAEILGFGGNLSRFHTNHGLMVEFVDRKIEACVWDFRYRKESAQEFKRVLGDLLVSSNLGAS